MHTTWKRIRGPFYTISCTPPQSHSWERYDYNRAGCLKCGEEHVCCDNLSFNKTCLIQEQDDGSHCCLITGLSIGSISISSNEYMEHCVFDKKSSTPTYKAWDTVHEQVSFVIRDFLFNKRMIQCKSKETQKKLQKVSNCAVNTLKSFKAKHPNELPNIHHLLAHILFHLNLSYSTMPSESVAAFCIQHITKCMFDLGFTTSIENKTSMVIGLLYLMKSGLCINNDYWLPKYNALNYCLPHENSLEKGFNLSIKIICETENEIKLLLRQRNRLL